MANAHWPIGASGQWALAIVAYTSDTHEVKALQSYTAIQRYTVYSYTSLYTIHPLQHPSGGEAAPLYLPRRASSHLLVIVDDEVGREVRRGQTLAFLLTG